MKYVMILAATLATVTAAGCGSSSKATCSDACSAIVTCANHLEVTPPFASVDECAAGCNAAVCADKQGSIDCIMAVQCTNISAVDAAITQCETTYCP